MARDLLRCGVILSILGLIVPGLPARIAWADAAATADGGAPGTGGTESRATATTTAKRNRLARSDLVRGRIPSSADELYERGNQAYLHGNYTGAIDAYEQLVESGAVHEDLYYALGNAYFKADRLGPAIFNYERALALDPAQDDAVANLLLCRQTAAQRWQDKLVGAAADPLWLRVVSSFTLGGLTLLGLALYALLFALVGVLWVLGPGVLRLACAVMLGFVVLGTLTSAVLLGGRWWLAERGGYGIVLPDEVQVKEGPDATYQTSFVIHAGLRVRAVSHDNEWLRVRLSNGLEGWIHDRDFGRL